MRLSRISARDRARFLVHLRQSCPDAGWIGASGHG